MSNSAEFRYCIRPPASESSTTDSAAEELSEIVARIKSEEPSLPFFEVNSATGAIEFKCREDAERVVDNPRINREAHGELILDVGPELANLPCSF